MDVRSEFLRAVRAAGCFQPGDPAVLGVSGGADSLAMLHLFAHAMDDLGVRPHVLHLNHHIRGGEADADADFVARTCREWGIACRIAEADVPALARQKRLTLEDAARQARYRALTEEAKRTEARVIAVAHNADDQAETVLMHFLRGSGLAGLRGMRDVTPLAEFRFLNSSDWASHGSPLLLRPMLGIPRAEIEAYCAVHDLTPRLDSTNLDTTYFRNRLRREIIPMLEKIAPSLRGRLARTASIIAADAAQLERDLEIAWADVATAEPANRVMFDLADWRALSPSLQRAAVRRAIGQLRAGLRNVGFTHVEDAVKVAQTGSTGAMATLPGGLTLRVGYDALVIAAAGDRPPEPGWPLLEPGEEIALAAPGEVDLPSGWRLTLSPYSGPCSGPAWDARLADPWCAALNLSPGIDLCLRTRRPGDRFQPQGAGGAQKVNEFMINAKIPAMWRDQLPLLVSGGQIAWVCGWRVDQRFVVTPETQNVWLAKFERA